MYSVVLATMITAGGEAPQWGHRCHGCHGCAGWSACHGCSGYAFGFGISFGCHGCTGCWGGCWGCYGGCSGFYACSGCSGFYACSGCSGFYACSGCSGVIVCSGCSGFYACSGCSGVIVCSGCNGAVGHRPPDMSMVPRNEAERKAVRDALKKAREKGKTGSEEEVSASPRPAVVTVNLPADATLYVDSVKCPLTSATRAFTTPALEPGREYYYTLRAEIVRDGVRRTQTQRVVIGAGREVGVQFNNFAAVQTASR